jgi:threonine aldolase
MEYIDLRSDTVTKPTPEMREAMAEAEVGDDVFGDDPTVNKLEAMAAEKLGKEAAIFVPSGTMGNLLALLVHCQRGDEVMVGSRSHIYLNEAGGMSALGGIHPWPIPNQKDGTLAIEDILASIRDAEDVHQPRTRLICLENTQNVCGGIPLSVEYTRQVGDVARANHLALHIDGARIFNAAAAQNVDAKDLTAPADSVMFCLSKGLVSPIGSMLVGTKQFVSRARHLRKMLGGGMRQVGVIAAAGIISLEKMTSRLAEDHVRAKRLVDGLRQVDAIILDENTPYTNMIFFELAGDVSLTPQQIGDKLLELGVQVDAYSRRFRLVTHYWIDDDAVEKTISAFNKVLR